VIEKRGDVTPETPPDATEVLKPQPDPAPSPVRFLRPDPATTRMATTAGGGGGKCKPEEPLR
jgi:hypothetical protein